MVIPSTRRADARVRLAVLLRRLEQAPGDVAAAFQLAETGLDHGFEGEAWPAVARAAERHPREPRLWQMLALLHRALDRSDRALAAFGRASTLAPADVRIAHGRALATLEAGLPAAAAFESALALSPGDGVLLTGHASALAAERRGAEGLAGLRDVLRANPGWIDGHQAFARLSAMLGHAGEASETVDAALAARPRDVALHVLRLSLLARLALPAERLDAAIAARRLLGDQPSLLVEEAIAASEAGRIDHADALFLAIGRHQNASLALAILRHLIRAQRFEEADGLAGRLAGGPEAVTAWAYRHTAWRALGDPRLDWLDQGGALVRSFDITSALPPLDRLAEVLRGIHAGVGQPLDQSVRGGTQTDGPLFARMEPEIRALRSAARDAIVRYLAELPPYDLAHPLLSAHRDEAPRFAGAWSVRLTGSGGGYHTNHIHGQGWLSSALYIALPPAVIDGDEGHLTIGAPPDELCVALPPTGTVRPVVGRLVIFPSHNWHGVSRFAGGERLTVAFDVARPRG